MNPWECKYKVELEIGDPEGESAPVFQYICSHPDKREWGCIIDECPEKTPQNNS